MGWVIYLMAAFALLFMAWAVRTFMPGPRWRRAVMGVAVSAAFFAVAWWQMHAVAEPNRVGWPGTGVARIGIPIAWQEVESGGCLIWKHEDGTMSNVHRVTSRPGGFVLCLLFWIAPLLAFWLLMLCQPKHGRK